MNDLTGPAVGETIQAFGGLAKMAKALGHKQSSTIFAWQKKERIPHWRLDAIRRAAHREGVDLPSAAQSSEAA